jgi:hypothetical protein
MSARGNLNPTNGHSNLVKPLRLPSFSGMPLDSSVLPVHTCNADEGVVIEEATSESCHSLRRVRDGLTVTDLSV